MEVKTRQSKTISEFLLNKSSRVKTAEHIALFLPMKSQELDITEFIEGLLKKQDKRIYVPHVLGPNREDMCFFELKNYDEYRHDMNEDNRFGLRQFKKPLSKIKIDSGLLDLVIVPGLMFEIDKESGKGVRRLGRGKGYYDEFLKGIGNNCRTLAIGFDEQLVQFNKELDGICVPMNDNDFWVEEFLSPFMVPL